MITYPDGPHGGIKAMSPWRRRKLEFRVNLEPASPAKEYVNCAGEDCLHVDEPSALRGGLCKPCRKGERDNHTRGK